MPCSAIFFISVYFCLENPFKLTLHDGLKSILKEKFICTRKYGPLSWPIFLPCGYARKLGAIWNDNISEEMTLVRTNTVLYTIAATAY